ncbi:MAG TPA: glutathione S-transferase N-terminal domain-containing protein [Myxococcota bacterium]|nr:glutathione S-transferase N-terminal domain-containing protein [Myxococcota bacterium]
MADEWIDVAEARRRAGLRLVSVKGVASPWSEAAKALLHVKKLPYVRVAHAAGGANAELVEWTGQNSAPVLAYDNERPRTGWAEILLLLERLAPEPRLVPPEPAERALLFGLVHELAGELGFGWCRRNHGIHLSATKLPPGPTRDGAEAFGRKYGYRPEEGELYARRVREVLALFTERLAAQRARGARYLLGDELTALDLYWAAFAALLQPLPAADCPMDAGMQAFYTLRDPAQRVPGDEMLLEHRDFIYRTHLELPIRL